MHCELNILYYYDMKKTFNHICRIVMLISIIVMGGTEMLRAQSISSLWKSYEEALEDDMPKTAIEALQQIEKKAEAQKKYGDLLMALLNERSMQAEISPDSAKAWETRMAVRHEQWKKSNGVIATLYQTARGSGYRRSVPDIDSLLASPDAKTYTKAGLAKTYKPFITIGDDSRYFNHDLLSIIAMETKQLRAMQRYYATTTNRAGACIAASLMPLRDSRAELDSLISIYQDLTECGALAVRKMNAFKYSEKGEKLAWIDESLRRWPSWRTMALMRNEREAMTRSEFSSRLPKEVANSDYSHTLYLTSVRNMNGVRVNIRRMQRNAKGEYEVINGDGADVRTFSHTFKAHNEYETWSDSVVIGRLPLGVWRVTVSDVDGRVSQSSAQIHITDMRVIEQTLPDQQRRYVVVNNISGHPVSGATLHLVDRTYRKDNPREERLFTTDENGECLTGNREGARAYATNGDDTGMPEEYIYNGYSCGSPRDRVTYTNLYTDRAIYRPGQTVHVGVLCHAMNEGKHTEVIPGKKVLLSLRDANYKEVSSKSVTTDEYGTATADFTLPEDGKNGSYSVRGSDGTSVSFRVEEYKRPTYEVKLDRPDISYKAGDTLTVRGTAKMYSGVPVANAKVAYSVKRSTPWWWRYWYDGGSDYDNTLMVDTVYTAADGSFTVRMPMTLPESAKTSTRCCFYSVEAVADVTDMAGESHSASLSLPISNRDVFFGLKMPREILADTMVTIKFTRLNNIGRDIEGTVAVTLDGKAMPDAVANKSYSLPSDIPSGKHELMAICGTDTVKHSFVVFRKNDTKPMTYTHDWWYQSADRFSEKDGTAWIQMATSDNDVYAVYSLFSGDKVLEKGSLRMDNNVLTRTFKYKEEYGDGITYTVAWVKNDELYTHSGSIRRVLPSKKLQMKWTTFRDKLIPGQKEQWTLNIKNPDGTPAKAQLMAVLYDKSLDAIVGHNWSISDHRVLYVPTAGWTSPSFGGVSIHSQYHYKTVDFKELDFSSISGTHVRPSYGSRRLYKMATRAGAPMMLESKAMVNDEAVVLNEVAVLKSKEVVDSDMEEASANDAGQETGQDDGLRTNFDETAFFMPQLVTDQKGSVALRFTLPESVTTWKFMGLAHDKEMRTGLLGGESVAQKQLMVQPRMPRFLRQGDKANISATVANLSEKPLSATVRMTLLDAKTDKELKTESMKVSVKAGETSAVTFPVDAAMLPEDGVVCRIIAEADGHKDGEQHLLPILPDTELVTTTRTWTLFHPGDSLIAIDELLPAAKAIGKAHLKVNYTDSPAWMMVETLHDIQTPDCGNAICLSAALYANAVTAAIKDTLLYSGTANVIAQLKNLQRGDGSFSWWPGMPGSRYMTMAVAKTLARLDMLAGNSKAASGWKTSVNAMYGGAMRFMAKEMADDVERMKKNKKEGYKPWLSDTQLDWLYTLTISGMDGGATADYLLKLVEKETKNSDMATKAVAAVVLNRNGRKKDARTFVESIKEHTVYRSDMGRYFDSYRAAYSWCNYRIPTQTMCIEALNAVTPKDRQTITEMQRWLLSSKRTQDWGNVYNTVNAVHAFFGGDASRLAKGTPATLKYNGAALGTKVLNERSGMVQGDTDITSKEGRGDILVGKQTEGESWVSAYVTSRQKSSDVEQATMGISIKREVITSTKGKAPKIGDKIKVRITVEADRDYDFVTVTDNRAACLEPVNQLSGYRYGYYQEIKDKLTAYHYNKLSKGTHVIETEYYIDREGTYNSGSATAVCAYADEFRGTTGAYTLQTVK